MSSMDDLLDEMLHVDCPTDEFEHRHGYLTRVSSCPEARRRWPGCRLTFRELENALDRARRANWRSATSARAYERLQAHGDKGDLMGRALCEELYVLSLIYSGNSLLCQLRTDFGGDILRRNLFDDFLMGHHFLRRALLARLPEPESHIRLTTEDHGHEGRLRRAISWVERLWQADGETRELRILPMSDEDRANVAGAEGVYHHHPDRNAPFEPDDLTGNARYARWIYGTSGHSEIRVDVLRRRHALKVYVHELAHHWESHCPEIVTACEIFHRLRQRRWESAQPPVEYGHWSESGGYNLVRSEIFSTGIEAILCGSFGQLRGLGLPWVPHHLRQSDQAQLLLVLGIIAMGALQPFDSS